MKDLATVSLQEQKEFLNSFDYFLTDADGVLWSLVGKIDGSGEAIRSLRNIGKKVIIVSNNSTKTMDMYYDQMTLNGIDPDPKRDEIVTPALAIIDYLKSINFTKKIFLIGMHGIKSLFVDAGFKLVETGIPDRLEETIPAVVKMVRTAQTNNLDIGAVILDIDVNINFTKIQEAAIYLQRPEVIFIKGGSDRRLPFVKMDLIGPGYFFEILEDISDRQGLKISKPSVHLKTYIERRYNLSSNSKVLFVGDSIPEDMGFAATCTYQKLLVLSGITKKEQIINWQHPEELKPNYYVESLKVIRDIIEKVNLAGES